MDISWASYEMLILDISTKPLSSYHTPDAIGISARETTKKYFQQG